MASADPPNTHGPRSLHSLAVLRCAGPDAASFLQGQLTCDVARLYAATALAALATPQGRVIAVLHLRRHDDAIYALLPRALLPPVATRLRRYVLRARVELTPLNGWAVTWTTIDRAGDTGSHPGLSFVYPDGRVLVAGPGEAAREDPLAEANWTAADIAAGLPQVSPATSEHFVPQMLNLDRLEAISFTKGCYTGQEIVARTQNLGRIKRRMFRYGVQAQEPLAPLTALHAEAAKVGEVLMSARAGPGVELLAVVALDARDRPLRTADGHTARPLPLPYSL